jgi:hypothetical protein
LLGPISSAQMSNGDSSGCSLPLPSSSGSIFKERDKMASPPAQAHLATDNVIAVPKSHDEDSKIEVDQASSSGSTPEALVAPARPPMDYSSFSAFTQSFSARWKSIWTRRFVLAMLAGQLVSICITCTNVTTTELVNRKWTLATTQGFFLLVTFPRYKGKF